MRRVIVNSTPLIILCNIGKLEILNYHRLKTVGCCGLKTTFCD